MQSWHSNRDTDRQTLTLWLFVAVVEHDISGVVDASCEVFHCTLAEFVNTEYVVVDVGDAVDVILKDVDAEWVKQLYRTERFVNVLLLL